MEKGFNSKNTREGTNGKTLKNRKTDHLKVSIGIFKKLFSLTAFLVCLECYLSLRPTKIDCNAVAQSLVDKKTDHQAFKINGT